MKSLTNLLGGLVLPFLILACTGESKVMKPTGNQISEIEILQEINTKSPPFCSQNEEELSYPDEAQKNRFTVQETIPVQDYIFHHCDGSIRKGKSEIRTLSKKVEIPTTLELRRTRKLVGFAEIRNHRSCDITRIGASAQEFFLPGFENYFSYLSKKGSLKLALNNDSYGGFGGWSKLLVMEGQNLVEIKYFGKCLRYKEKQDNQEKIAELPEHCLEAERIATRWVTIDVQIEHPEAEGLQEVHEKNCSLKK